MMTTRDSIAVAFILAATSLPAAKSHAPAPRVIPEPPPLFPRFSVPGAERHMALLHELFFLHYPGVFLGATFSAHWLAQSLLWPALPEYHGMNYRQHIRTQLLNFRLSPEGYVSCHQHEGLAHPEGWPFPFYAQSLGAGWQFIPHFYPDISIPTLDISAFTLRGCQTISRDFTNGWRIRISQPRASLEFPPLSVNGVVASFFLIKWALSNVPTNASCSLEFRSNNQRHFSHLQHIPVPFSDTSQQFSSVWLQLLAHPRWKTNDTLSGLRLVFDNATAAELSRSRLHRRRYPPQYQQSHLH